MLIKGDLQLNWNLTKLPSSPFLFHVYTKNSKKSFLPLGERENCWKCICLAEKQKKVLAKFGPFVNPVQ